MKKNNHIKCEVLSCRYNCENCCSLDEIKVSCDCDGAKASKDQTICDSFKKDSKK